METKRTGMFCLNSTITKQGGTAEGQATGITIGNDHVEMSVITRVDNFELSEEQITKIKAVHDHTAAKIKEILGW